MARPEAIEKYRNQFTGPSDPLGTFFAGLPGLVPPMLLLYAENTSEVPNRTDLHGLAVFYGPW